MQSKNSSGPYGDLLVVLVTFCLLFGVSFSASKKQIINQNI